MRHMVVLAALGLLVSSAAISLGDVEMERAAERAEAAATRSEAAAVRAEAGAKRVEDAVERLEKAIERMDRQGVPGRPAPKVVPR